MAGTTYNPYRFGGQVGYRRDSAGRQYVRARHLDTAKGRWASRDPLGSDGDRNAYAYAGNDPVNYADPTGLIRLIPVGTGRPGWQIGPTSPGPGDYSVQWYVVLDKPAPCDGFVVQHVTQSGTMYGCNGSPIRPPYSISYYKVWPLVRKTKRPAPKGPIVVGTDWFAHGSSFTPAPPVNYCPSSGSFAAQGTMKFFCSDELKTNRPSGWPRGKAGVPNAGGAPSQYAQPIWWTMTSRSGEPAATHSATIIWNCCPGDPPCNSSVATQHP